MQQPAAAIGVERDGGIKIGALQIAIGPGALK